jgi:hypothetical protein
MTLFCQLTTDARNKEDAPDNTDGLLDNDSLDCFGIAVGLWDRLERISSDLDKVTCSVQSPIDLSFSRRDWSCRLAIRLIYTARNPPSHLQADVLRHQISDVLELCLYNSALMFMHEAEAAYDPFFGNGDPLIKRNLFPALLSLDCGRDDIIELWF